MKPAASSGAAPRGLTAMGIFLMFGMCMATLAAITLTWPGTPLDQAWRLNPDAYARLAPIGKTAGPLFFLLAVVLALAASGWLGRRLWGWCLATALIAIQALAGIVNLFLGSILEGLTGAVLASALVFYLLRASVRSAFSSGTRRRQSPP